MPEKKVKKANKAGAPKSAKRKPAAKPKMPAKIGRPSDFTQEIADVICERIAEGESIRSICLSENMPSKTTVMRWLGDESRKGFRDQYARAREEQADKLAEEILKIADEGLNDTYVDENGNTRTDQDVIGRSRLRVDARKWLAGKLAPKKYGDKVAIGGADDLPPILTKNAKDMTDEELAAIAAGSGARTPDQA